MWVVGLTGGIGSGKTTVSNRFAQQHGTPVVDMDLLAREVVEPGQPALAEIVAHFGPDCLDDAGQLQRARLRERVFADADGRQRLEAILHPRIRRLARERIAALTTTPYCLLVIPLLAETGKMELINRVLVVDAPEAEQIRRVMVRDHVDETQARRILAAQASRAERLALADDILENAGDWEQLDRQIAVLHQRYRVLAATRPA